MPFRKYTSLSITYITHFSTRMTSIRWDHMSPRHTNFHHEAQSPSASKFLTVKTTKLLPYWTSRSRGCYIADALIRTSNQIATVLIKNCQPYEVTLTAKTEISSIETVLEEPKAINVDLLSTQLKDTPLPQDLDKKQQNKFIQNVPTFTNLQGKWTQKLQELEI